jgi:uncharacterized membrane protein
MLEVLNANEGVIATISLVVVIVIAIIGFYINKNISKFSQNQKVEKGSKGLQAGRDAIDNSYNEKD